MSATVEIRTEYADDVLIIPIGAVTTRSDTAVVSDDNAPDQSIGNETKDDFVEVVFVFEDGKTRRQQVEIGIQDNTNIEIKEGLEEGDEVITGPYSLVSKTLRDGMAVKKTDRKDLFKED
jgi:HlyD family secretion protein